MQKKLDRVLPENLRIDEEDWGYQHPVLIIVLAFFSITLLVGSIFHHDRKKIKSDQMQLPAKQAKQVKQMANTLHRHLKATLPTGKPLKIKPLLNALTMVYCPMNNRQYVPLCSRCNIPYEVVGKNSFRCPSCKQQAIFTCPDQPNHKMVEWTSLLARQKDPTLTYVCPVCAHSGPPKWDSRGVPRCSYCLNVMKL
ncbi:MAG: hypothetical protein HN353_05595 [Bdellovibrionales bacterium]|jgi:hypothetical protein|nr:hypothetical protein [Bdellovibrionales bacterium]MBT3525084.1 hypothetical protein [Bdellovibrionales bacterium]MBT7669776.1 hypothetical protein [Bdellovibrionales bacterium]MBT7767395.1 hypothetical protein [Bdellovibrionales bacterium]